MRRRRREGGFALLFVLLMSAAVAVMLYQQLPRVAFESMRAKEEMLIERGEQYQRAIQLYVGKMKRYPQSMDDLEKSGGQRFLRKKYKDPFTGKDDWRVIQVDAMGQLTNSKIQKKEEKKGGENKFVSEFAGIGQTQTTGVQGVNVALRRRPSDSAVETGGYGGSSLPLPSSQEPMSQADLFAQFQKQQEAQMKQQQAQQQGQAGQPGVPMAPGGVPNPMLQQPGQPGQPGQAPVPGPQGQPGQPSLQQAYPNGMPGQPGGVGVGQQTPFGQQPTYPQQAAGQAGRPGTIGTPNAAVDMIRQALTSPSPNIPMAMAPGMQLGPGIAGIASKHESPSIKIYNEQQTYDKWEFIYDPRKDKRTQQQLAQMGVQMGQPNMQNPNQMGGGGLNQQPGGFNQQQPGGFNQQQPGFPSQQGFQQPGAGRGQSNFGIQPPAGFGGSTPTAPPVPGRPGSTPSPGGFPQQPGFPQPRR